MAICTWNWFFYFWLRCFTIYLYCCSHSRHICTLHSHDDYCWCCFPFAIFTQLSLSLPLSQAIQLKRFLFLFHIYVKIHFVFYSNVWVSLRTQFYIYVSHTLIPAKKNWDHIWAVQGNAEEKKSYMSNRTCPAKLQNKKANKNPQHITSTKTRQGNEMACITIDMAFDKKRKKIEMEKEKSK